MTYVTHEIPPPSVILSLRFCDIQEVTSRFMVRKTSGDERDPKCGTGEGERGERECKGEVTTVRTVRV